MLPARRPNRLEGEVELLDQKIGREEQRMFAGTVSNPKELSALQAEVESWAGRYWGGEYWPPLANLARLAEEVGEIARQRRAFA